ncbi:MAG: helix-turn-helix domain-containing protein [Candidatus Thiodiazotropha sp. (ex Lucinoma aequizonata)]|nr:helix-turn-helix domain-containing protein [Candidatus Thiodiazotropha sp. (ex Lucinoma aequizonata)]MCU7889951.1 helix-turn-helix domain-containing protein [Candidatus Thiodiazotropha sp. (ex Lucinoma aequizonata)]MCU7895206.1 helix-turn-helix domain-containing protein [Candidatus Thiodiazotropha sp. (ex Lucinoma aequizonata)]MCU7898425.1 helix-turn-helix domain-containing protein [Candidatus Thiodiazotropha sp. (ex Lucinoma aequizonata)]MCU7901330.1 helix-turn-helix domain-containing prote
MMNKVGHSQIEIAQLLYRGASTISREFRRNRGLRGYRPAQTQRLSEARRRESRKTCKITDEVREWIETLICQELSPQQIVDYLKRHKRSLTTMESGAKAVSPR